MKSDDTIFDGDQTVHMADDPEKELRRYLENLPVQRTETPQISGFLPERSRISSGSDT
jgi:hypothetical protein